MLDSSEQGIAHDFPSTPCQFFQRPRPAVEIIHSTQNLLHSNVKQLLPFL
ncbi:hypothetical protein GCAAIG_09790 [Candidatus Electronema halotolerans]|jgi:hypothetical protein